MNKLLSVIIPTRNRQIYCVESIKSVLDDLDDTCEIIVQDNSTDSQLEHMLSELNSSKIIYNYNAAPLSFIDNFEQALNLSNGDYFIILGDDDSTTKDIVPIVKWMQQEGIESISSSFVVDYIWPNQNIAKYKTGSLSIPHYNGNVEEIDVQRNLNRLIENGFLAYQLFKLPRTYHGIVKRSCMDQIKAVAGRYFGGLTPDIYSTVALATVIKKHVIVDFPFSIAGACPASATVNATVGGHSGELKDAPHFNFRGEYKWENVIPRYYSVETIWAETAIKALKDLNYPNWERLFNKYKLYAYGIYINRKYILNLSLVETYKLYKDLAIGKTRHVLNLISVFLKIIFSKFFRRQSNIKSVEYDVLDNIYSLQSCKSKVYDNIQSIRKPHEVR